MKKNTTRVYEGKKHADDEAERTPTTERTIPGFLQKVSEKLWVEILLNIIFWFLVSHCKKEPLPPKKESETNTTPSGSHGVPTPAVLQATTTLNLRPLLRLLLSFLPTPELSEHRSSRSPEME